LKFSFWKKYILKDSIFAFIDFFSLIFFSGENFNISENTIINVEAAKVLWYPGHVQGSYIFDEDVIKTCSIVLLTCQNKYYQ
jgi:hypothetical protein